MKFATCVVGRTIRCSQQIPDTRAELTARASTRRKKDGQKKKIADSAALSDDPKREHIGMKVKCPAHRPSNQPCMISSPQISPAVGWLTEIFSITQI